MKARMSLLPWALTATLTALVLVLMLHPCPRSGTTELVWSAHRAPTASATDRARTISLAAPAAVNVHAAPPALRSYAAPIDAVLVGCGDVCRTDMPATPGKFFDVVEKVIDCAALMTNAAIDGGRAAHCQRFPHAARGTRHAPAGGMPRAASRPQRAGSSRSALSVPHVLPHAPTPPPSFTPLPRPARSGHARVRAAGAHPRSPGGRVHLRRPRRGAPAARRPQALEPALPRRQRRRVQLDTRDAG